MLLTNLHVQGFIDRTNLHTVAQTWSCWSRHVNFHLGDASRFSYLNGEENGSNSSGKRALAFQKKLELKKIWVSCFRRIPCFSSRLRMCSLFTDCSYLTWGGRGKMGEGAERGNTQLFPTRKKGNPFEFIPYERFTLGHIPLNCRHWTIYGRLPFLPLLPGRMSKHEIYQDDLFDTLQAMLQLSCIKFH